MKSIFRKEGIIGLLVILALAILFFGINFLKGVNIFKAANYFYATYTNVEGLSQSAPVMLNGYKIGIVREINYDFDNPGHVTVELSLDKKLRLPRGTKALVTTDMLGTASIELAMGDRAEGFYAVGDTLISEKKAGMMDAITGSLMPSVNAIFPKIDTLLTSLNTIVGDPALITSVQRLDGLTAQLDASIRSLHNILAAMGPVTKDFKSITENVDTITGDLAAVSARLREVPVDSLMTDLRATVANLEALTAQLNNPDSSIGKLTHDPELYNNLNSTVASLDSLFVDIKRNPKRYISIKLL